MSSFSIQYIFRLIDRFTPGAGKLSAAALKMRNSIAAAGAAMGPLARSIGLAAVAVGTLAAAFAVTGVKKAAAFEDAMAGVRRVTDITRKEMLEYGKDALRIGVATGQSGEQIAEIMKQGAMMGLRGQATLGSFAEVVSQIAVAWDDISTEEAAGQIARLSAKFFGDKGPAEQAASIRDVSDAINELSNRSAFKAPELLKYFDRGAAAAKRFGLTAQQAAAYGGAALVLGEPTGELQGTRARMTFQRLINATTGATRNKKGLTKLGQSFKALGMTQSQFSEMLNSDPQRLLLTLAEKLNGMDKTSAQHVADGIFDSRSSAQFLSIAQNVNEYKRQLAIADDAWAKEFTQDKKFMDWLRNSGEGNKELADQLDRYGKVASRSASVQREFAKRTETLSFAWRQLGLAFDRVHVLAALPLLEPLRRIVNKVTDAFSSLGNAAETYPNLFSNLFKGLSTAAVGAAGYGLLQLTAWMTGAASAGAALKALGLITLKFAVIALGIASAYWIYENWDKLKELAKDPIKFSVLFPEAPGWLKTFFDDAAKIKAQQRDRWANEAFAADSRNQDWFGYSNVVNLSAFRAAQRNSDLARATYSPFQQMQSYNAPSQGWWDRATGTDPAWGSGNGAFNAASIPQSMAVNVTAHTTFAPAVVTVTGRVDAITGSTTIQAKPSRGTSSVEAGSGPAYDNPGAASP